MSQKGAAALLKVSDDTLRNWESGTTRPREESVAALAEFCGVPLEELLASEPEVQKPTAPLLPIEAEGRVVSDVGARRRKAWVAIGVLVGTGALGVSSFVLWWRSGRFDTLRSTANGVTAVSRSGKVLWRAVGVDPQIAERWTLVRMPGGRTLIACVFAKPSDYRPEVVSTLSLLEPNARSLKVVERIVLPAPGGKLFPGHARRYQLAYLRVLDLDDDGIDEILATYQQVPECVSYTVLYEPANGRARVVFVQTGAHHFAGAWDLDDDGRRDLVFLGINNGYGWVNALAAVRLRPWVGVRSVGDESAVFSPDAAAYLPSESEALFYALLPRGRVPDDPAAVSWDSRRRALSVKLANGREVEVSPLGFLLSSRNARLEAYRRDRESRRLGHAGFADDGVLESRAAVLAAVRSGDEILREAMERGLARALVAAGNTKEAEELVTRLTRDSENASEIFYEAGVSFHLVGDLRRAISYYEAGIRRGGSPEAGKSKHEFIQAEVLALVELGEFAAAEQAIDRFRDRYVTGEEDWTTPYREFIRWRKGESPAPESVSLPPNATDLMRYWRLEFRNARGEDPAVLVRETNDLLAEGNRPRGAILSLRSTLLERTGHTDEARVSAAAAWTEGLREATSSVVSRGHFQLIGRRAGRFEPPGNSAVSGRTAAIGIPHGHRVVD